MFKNMLPQSLREQNVSIAMKKPHFPLHSIHFQESLIIRLNIERLHLTQSTQNCFFQPGTKRTTCVVMKKILKVEISYSPSSFLPSSICSAFFIIKLINESSPVPKTISCRSSGFCSSSIRSMIRFASGSNIRAASRIVSNGMYTGIFLFLPVMTESKAPPKKPSIDGVRSVSPDTWFADSTSVQFLSKNWT